MKKTLSIILAVLMVVTAVPFTAISVLGAEPTAEYRYIVDETQTAITIIELKGDVAELIIPEKIDGYKVEAIGEKAFENCTSLEKVVIPDTVTEIGSYAFNGCTNLNEIIVPDSLTNIGQYAFSGTVPYKNFLDSSDKVFYLGNHLIRVKISATSVEIKAGTLSIADYAFAQCRDLSSIVVPDGVVSIGEGAFEYCDKLASITLPNSVRRIGKEAFAYTAYMDDAANWCDVNNEYNNVKTNLYVSDHLVKSNVGSGDYVVRGRTKSIADEAFVDCKANRIGMPIAVKAIGERAFKNCTDLEYILISNSVQYIGESAFEGCTSLSKLYFNGSINHWVDIEFGNALANPMYYTTDESFTDNFEDDLFLISRIEEIKPYAFYNCDVLKSITMSENVKKIGYMAFYNCVKLEYIGLYPKLEYIGHSAFLKCDNLVDFEYAGTVDEWAQIEFGNALSNPMYYAQNEYVHTGLVENVILATNIESVSKYAFYNCDSMKTIIIPTSVKTIEDDAFYGCNALTDVYYRGTEDEWKNLGIGIENYPITHNATIHYNYAPPVADVADFKYSKNTGNNGITITGYTGNLVSFEIPSTIEGRSVTDIGLRSFDFTDVVEIVIPSTVKRIRNYSFMNCYYLQKITFKGSLEYIGRKAFESCSVLGEIIIPEGTEEIHEDAFYYCTSLNSIVLPGSLTDISPNAFYESGYYLNADNWENDVLYIGKYLICAYNTIDEPFEYEGTYVVKDGTRLIAQEAFLGCYDLTDVSFPESLRYINDYAFTACTEMAEVSFNEGLLEIGKDAFSGCDALTSVVLPNTVDTLGDSAFADCVGLTDIVLSENIDKINTTTFYGCTALKNITISSQYLNSISMRAFTDCQNLENVYFAGTADDWARIDFNNNDCTNPMTFAENLYFNNELVTDLVFENASQINPYAFANCTGIKSVFIPKTLSGIGEDAFAGCENIVDVYYEGTWEEWQNVNGAVREKARMHYNVTDSKTHYQLTTIKEPTCAEQGMEQVMCPCGFVNGMITFIEPTNHSYGEWTVVTAPTESQTGTKQRACKDCGNVETAELTYDEYIGIYECDIIILTPSRTEIRSRDGIILHASVNGNIPEGAKIVWSADNDNFKTENSEDGKSLTIISKNNGTTVITAKLVDINGNVLSIDNIEMTSKASFFARLGGFFRNLFGTTKIYEN